MRRVFGLVAAAAVVWGSTGWADAQIMAGFPGYGYGYGVTVGYGMPYGYGYSAGYGYGGYGVGGFGGYGYGSPLSGLGYGLPYGANGYGYGTAIYSPYSSYYANPAAGLYYRGYASPAYGYGMGYPRYSGFGYGGYGQGRFVATSPFMGLPRPNAGLVRVPY